jgi:hypothetical protein
MTNRTLKRLFIGAGLLYGFAIATGLYLGIINSQNPYVLFKDLSGFFIAFPAVYLTYSLQRRSSYLQALRDFWKILIPAVQSAVQYTHREEPDSKEFSVVAKDLSTVIDAVRGVFYNLPSASEIGLYPYEPLKEILSVISWVNEKNRSQYERHLARRCILQLWFDVHKALLLEFDREIPVKGVSKYLKGEITVADRLFDGSLDEKKHFRN